MNNQITADLPVFLDTYRTIIVIVVVVSTLVLIVAKRLIPIH